MSKDEEACSDELQFKRQSAGKVRQSGVRSELQ
jgi:hypothetical protein